MPSPSAAGGGELLASSTPEACEDDNLPSSHEDDDVPHHVPLWAYAVLAVAVLAMSTGGIWFALLGDATPPLMQACWRLTLTSVLQVAGFVYEVRSDPSLDAAFWTRFHHTWGLLITVGLALGVHFGSWGWSIAHTSLLDSLLLVSSVPLLLVILMVARWCFRRHVPHASTTTSDKALSDNNGIVVPHTPHDTPQAPYACHADLSPASAGHDASLLPSLESAHITSDDDDDGTTAAPPPRLVHILCCPRQALGPTWMEAVGAVLAFAGVLVLVVITPPSDVSTHTTPPTVAGNLAALLGAAAVIVYLEGGAACRKWMPLFVYALPVTATAAIGLAVASLATESSTTVTGLGPAALFGFFGDGRRFGLAFGAALVSGIAGHTLANLAVKYVSPLVVGVAVLWEPLLGSVVGFFVGVQGPPDAMALVATPLLLGGALLVTLGGRDLAWHTRRPCWRQKAEAVEIRISY
ncbi:Aste57867_16210 [Aphanomyces stellatus]|uniref:Aste57867_16210 protein n=1 Tax=Aphanomyces stellatus TaxID=120398 RepID=A0A485L564_9STRA|nr:hypothetical protein As57867_016153 [Aphanomyces stellatus]VFT92988.1 Aste57867_16210 [Aphanomyces stellatus]